MHRATGWEDGVTSSPHGFPVELLMPFGDEAVLPQAPSREAILCFLTVVNLLAIISIMAMGSQCSCGDPV